MGGARGRPSEARGGSRRLGSASFGLGSALARCPPRAYLPRASSRLFASTAPRRTGRRAARAARRSAASRTRGHTCAMRGTREASCQSPTGRRLSAADHGMLAAAATAVTAVTAAQPRQRRAPEGVPLIGKAEERQRTQQQEAVEGDEGEAEARERVDDRKPSARGRFGMQAQLVELASLEVLDVTTCMLRAVGSSQKERVSGLMPIVVASTRRGASCVDSAKGQTTPCQWSRRRSSPRPERCRHGAGRTRVSAEGMRPGQGRQAGEPDHITDTWTGFSSQVLLWEALV